MVAENGHFRSGHRRSRSQVSCSYGRRSSVSHAAAAAHLRALDGSAPMSGNNSVRSRTNDAATAIAGRAEPPKAAATAGGLAAPLTRAATGAPGAAAHATRRSESAPAAATTLAAAPSAPEACFTGGSHISTKENPPRATRMPAKEAASGARSTTTGAAHKNSMQNGDSVRTCTLGRRTEATHCLRGLKKLHVLPAGQRADNWQVFQVLKMFMKEKKIVHPCMSFRVPLEKSLATANLPSRQTPVSKVAEASGAAASRGDVSHCFFVYSPRPSSIVSLPSSSSSLPFPACAAEALSSSRHSEFSSNFSVPTSPPVHGAYKAFLPHRTRLHSCSSSASSSCTSYSAAPDSGLLPLRFLPSDFSGKEEGGEEEAQEEKERKGSDERSAGRRRKGRQPESETAEEDAQDEEDGEEHEGRRGRRGRKAVYEPGISGDIGMEKAECPPGSFSPSCSTTYVVVDCSPTSGLLTADTVVYLSGAPLQRLRRVQLMALVHPNSAYGRRAGISSYQQVFERRPDFPCLEQEDQPLLREAPAHVRDFERTVQTPEGAAADATDMGERDAAAADSTTVECDRMVEDESPRTAKGGDTAASVGILRRRIKAVECPAKRGDAGVTSAGETEQELATASRADAGKRAPATGMRVLKDVLHSPDTGAGEKENHEQERRGHMQEFSSQVLPAEVTARGGRDQIPCCGVVEKADAEVVEDADAEVENADYKQALGVSNEVERLGQDRVVTCARGRPPIIASSADTFLAATGFGDVGRDAAGSTSLLAAPVAAYPTTDFSGESYTCIHEDNTDDAAAERKIFLLNCCATLGSTGLHVCSCVSAASTPGRRFEKGSRFRSQSVSVFPNNNRSCSVQTKRTCLSSKRSAHDSRSSSGNNNSSCCSGSGGGAIDAGKTDVCDLTNGGGGPPRSSSCESKKSRGRNQTPACNVGILPRPLSHSSSISRRCSVSASFGNRIVLCSSGTRGVSITRTARGLSTEWSPGTDRKNVEEDCKIIADGPAPGKTRPSASARSAAGDQCPSIEGDMQQQRVFMGCAVCAQSHTVRRVSRLHQQQQQREMACMRQRRRILHIASKRDAQEDAVSTPTGEPRAQAAAAFAGDSSSRTGGEGGVAAENAGFKRAAAPRVRTEEKAGLLRCAAAAPRTANEEAGFLWCDVEVVRRTTEGEACSGGRAERSERAEDEEISVAGYASGAAAGKLTTGDAAAARVAAAGKDLPAGRTVAAEKETVAAGKAVADGRTMTAGKATAAGGAAARVTERGAGRPAEREWRVRPTHEPQKVRLQRLDAETLFRYFVGPYLQRKLGKRHSTSENKDRAENREEEGEGKCGGGRTVEGATHYQGTRIGGRRGKGQCEKNQRGFSGRRGGEAGELDEEEASQPKDTLVLYPGKELVIRDVTFVVWAADPAGVPGLLDEDTVIYICLDPYGEYRRVHFVPFSDTLPTTYTFHFYEDYLKPFLLENKWRNFRRGDVFSYRGVEFKLIATEPSSSVGARVGPATVVYHEGTMQPTVMDVLPADVLNHIRRLPARMQPAAIIFAAQRLDPEVLMRVVPSASAMRSRRGLNEQTAETLREKLVHPFSFAAYVKKYPDLCCRIIPATTEQSSEGASASSLPARTTCSDRHHNICWLENRASGSSAAGAVGSNGVDKQSPSGKPTHTVPPDPAADKEDGEAVSVVFASAASRESMENVKRCDKRATACAVQLASSQLAHRGILVPPAEGPRGEGLFIHTQRGFDSQGEPYSDTKQNHEDDISNFERPSCTVCTLPMEERDASILLFCGHVFHWQCIYLWLRYNSTCPNCRADITELFQKHEDSLRRRRTDSDVEREEHREGGTGENASEEEGALWIVSTIRRWVSNALSGTVQL